MRIQNNITAMNSHRNYNINQASLAKNIEKLSSGYRINRAGDDAAGLAISEKMRAQIRGLTMASKNSQDAISLVQTAEGALQSAHDVLQRMRELAVQSASDTNETTIDRDALQKEFAQLIQEINDTASKTKFNDMNLIDGTFAKSITTAYSTNSAVNFAWASDKIAKASYTIAFKDITRTIEVALVTGTATSIGSFIVSSENGPVQASFSASSGGVTGAQYNGVWNIGISGGNLVAENQTTGQKIEALFDSIVQGAVNSIPISLGPLGSIIIDTGSSTAPGSSTAGINATSFNSFSGQIVVTGAVDKKDAEYAHVAVLLGEEIELHTGQTTLNFKSTGISVQLKDSIVANTNTTVMSSGKLNQNSTIDVTVARSDGKALTIQTGANEGDTMLLNLSKLDAYSLGIANSRISNRMDASVAITQANTALNIISTQRAALGAIQNRLDYKIANLDTSAENLQAAESRIRDVDMAKEMTKFTKNNILFQASTAMLAQANALPQGVLQLLG